MADNFAQLPPSSYGLKLRSRQRTVSSNAVLERYAISIPERVSSGKVLASTFRVPGLTTTPHNVFTLENGASSTVLVGLRALFFEAVGTTATLDNILVTFRTFIGTTTPSGGTTATKALFDSTGASNANVVARGAASADGTANAITYALPATTPIWQTFWTPAVTAGVFPSIPYPLLPESNRDDPLVLRPGESLLVAAVTGSLATNHYIVNAQWDEFTLP